MSTEEKKGPSKEEIINFYKEQIEIAEYRKDLSALNAIIAENEARRIEAIAKAAHFSKPQGSPPEDGALPPGVVEHIVTQEDLDNNPQLADEGIKVGDRIGIAAEPPTGDKNTPVTSMNVEEKKERKLKKVTEEE